MRGDAVEEDYVDDPIRLFDGEQSRVCYTESADTVVEDPGFVIDTTKEEERFDKILSAFRNKTSLLPVTFFENDRNVKLLSECCPLTINIVDCGKFVNYCEKTKDLEICSNVTNVNQHLTHNYTNRTIENTTEVVSKQVFDQINLKGRETTYIGNINNTQSAITNKNIGHKIKSRSGDANELNCPKLGTPIKSLNDELNVNRDHKQLTNNLKQTSNKRKCAVEKEINNMQEKQLADIKTVKINRPGTKVTEHCQYKSISRADIATTIVDLCSPKKQPTSVNKNYYEQIMKFQMSDISRNESLKTHVMSNHERKIDSIQASCVPLLPPKLSQCKTLNPNTSITTPCTKSMCDKRLFSGSKEIPHYHNTSSTNTVINRQKDHNLNKTDCTACKGNNYNSLNKDISIISNRNMNNNYISNNNNITSNLTPNKFILPYGSNYVISQKSKDNTNIPNMRITVDGYENPPGLRDTSKGMCVTQTNNDIIPPLLNQNHLINAINPQNSSIRRSVLRNNYSQTYIQPPPPPSLPINLNIYKGNLHPPINILSGARDLPVVVRNQPIAHSNKNCLLVRPNFQPQTKVSQAQSCFMEKKEGMRHIRPSVIQNNGTNNISNLIYLKGTSTSTNQLNQSIKRKGHQNKNIIILNQHPHLVKALEDQSIEKNPEADKFIKHQHLVKALKDQPINKDNNTTKVINLNVISTVNKKHITVRSNSAIDKINKTENSNTELNKINKSETIFKSNTSVSNYKTVENGKKVDQNSDNINKPAKKTTTTKDIKQNQLKMNKIIDISKPNATNGYSPPILPIPSYQKVFEILSTIKYYYFEGDKMYVNTEKTNDNIEYNTPLKSLPTKPILKKADKRKIEDENVKYPRKITINEYKERHSVVRK